MSKSRNTDDFWDISALVPTKKKAMASAPKKIIAVEIAVAPPKAEKQQADTENSLCNISKPTKAEKKENSTEYIPKNRLIQKVKISNWAGSISYYELFCRQAEYYRKVKPSECQHEHFFSYMPQFSQMNRAQLGWYIWWRSRVENNIFPDTDVTYIQLYAFELINTSDESTAQKSLDSMIDVWKNYREVYPQLDRTLGEWICDFMLIHRLSVKFPDSRISREMITAVSVPEIFYSLDFSDIPLLTKFLLSYCNSYNYRKSKAYDEKTAELYEKHIPAVVQKVLSESDLGQKLFTETMKRTGKTAYMGALCSNRAKKRIEISYTSLALENELRASISDIIKYAENKLRAAIGIRSRLSVKSVTNEVTCIIDSYFKATFGKENFNYGIPEYEKLYEAKSEPLSFETAKEIEQKSWDITQKLVEAFEDTESQSEEPIQPVCVSHAEPSFQNSDSPIQQFYYMIKNYTELFTLIKEERFDEQILYVKANKIIFEAAADEINDAAAEVFGDILLEEADVGYKIIDDYKDIFD